MYVVLNVHCHDGFTEESNSYVCVATGESLQAASSSGKRPIQFWFQRILFSHIIHLLNRRWWCFDGHNAAKTHGYIHLDAFTERLQCQSLSLEQAIQHQQPVAPAEPLCILKFDGKPLCLVVGFFFCQFPFCSCICGQCYVLQSSISKQIFSKVYLNLSKQKIYSVRQCLKLKTVQCRSPFVVTQVTLWAAKLLPTKLWIAFVHVYIAFFTRKAVAWNVPCFFLSVF